MKFRSYFSGILLISLAACQQPSTHMPEVSQQELAAEEAYQQHMLDDAKKTGGVVSPWRNRAGISKQFERAADRVDRAGGKMCQELGLPDQDRRCYFYFKISRDDELNAHADGNTIVIYNGMMRFLKDEDEVGIVLAHELAHNMMGHPAASTNNVMAGALLGALVDTVAASQGLSTGGGLSDMGANAGLLSYSVSFEEEADYVGLYIAARAGYDISKAAGLWRRMTLENPKGLFREVTHPSNPRRAAALNKTVYEINYKRENGVALIPDFKG